MTHQSFININTERLALRRVKETDWKEVLFLRSNEQVTRFIHRSEDKMTKTKADAILFIQNINKGIDENNCHFWGITLKDHSQIIGTVCLWNFKEAEQSAEIGYDLKPEHQGKGLMAEALRSIIEFGFTTLRLSKIEAYTHRDNIRSKKLLEKHGFTINQSKRDLNNKNNIIYELVSYLQHPII